MTKEPTRVYGVSSLAPEASVSINGRPIEVSIGARDS